LKRRHDLKTALVDAITEAKLPEYFSDIDGFYNFIAASVRQVPMNTKSMHMQDLAYFYVCGLSKDLCLVKDPEFQLWNVAFHSAWGEFLNTDQSSGYLDGYIKDPKFKIEDYQKPHSGWHCFNSFFARNVKPGKRPIAQACDPAVVVSPCDFEMLSPPELISEQSTVKAKDVELKIADLLDNSQYGGEFHGGLYLTGFLRVHDYHRFHTPVAGKVLESLLIPGEVGMNFRKNEKDEIEPVLTPGFQFTQARALLLMDSPAMGLVALLPIGMAQISSIILTAEPGVELSKGEEFGYFQFGGSCMLMLTQEDRFEFTDDHLEDKPLQFLQGQRFGRTA
jgi:phosphatidylserine decarboxylase